MYYLSPLIFALSHLFFPSFHLSLLHLSLLGSSQINVLPFSLIFALSHLFSLLLPLPPWFLHWAYKVNAADNKQRDPSMNMIKIIIDP